MLITLALTPVTLFNVSATVCKELDPWAIDIVFEVFDEFKPKFAPVWPIVTEPSRTDAFGTILVTVLKTLLPEEVFPSVGPVIVSVIILPATSVPVTVKPVDDRSPPSEVIDIVPWREEWEIGVPKDVPETTDFFE